MEDEKTFEEILVDHLLKEINVEDEKTFEEILVDHLLNAIAVADEQDATAIQGYIQ